MTFEVKRCGERPVRQTVEGNLAAGFTHDQLGCCCVHRTALLQRQHRVVTTSSHLAKRYGDRPQRTHAIGGIGEWLRCVDQPAWVS